MLLGCGWGEKSRKAEAQGNNFVPGNPYITAADLRAIDVRNGGKYRVVQRTPGRSGSELLIDQARQAFKVKTRLFGFFGVTGGNG